jgi:iron complex transport system permease protein
MLAILLALVSLASGDIQLSAAQVFAALAGDGGAVDRLVVNTFRLPRMVAAIVVGIAFAVSGALLQSLTRNPLGSPDILGINAGAAFGALLSIVVFREVTLGMPIAGLIGALLAAGLCALLAAGGGVGRLILVGIGLNIALTAGVDLLMRRADTIQAAQATLWLTGSLNDASFASMQPAVIGLALFLPLALWVAPDLDRLALSDDLARGLGVRALQVRGLTVLSAVGLAALAVTTAGPIAFIAFLAGPIARGLVGSPNVCVMTSALVGATIMLGADLVSRVALQPTILPVGVTTALLGAPYLMWILARQARKGDL